MRSKIAQRILDRTSEETRKVTAFYTSLLLNPAVRFLENQYFLNLGELSPEEYCFKIGKQLIKREVSITVKEFLSEIKRYFSKNEKVEHVLMDIVKHFINLYQDNG